MSEAGVGVVAFCDLVASEEQPEAEPAISDPVTEALPR